MTAPKEDGTPSDPQPVAGPLSAAPGELLGHAKRVQQGETLTAALDAIQRHRTGELK